jgi:hypothetical protein
MVVCILLYSSTSLTPHSFFYSFPSLPFLQHLLSQSTPLNIGGYGGGGGLSEQHHMAFIDLNDNVGSYSPHLAPQQQQSQSQSQHTTATSTTSTSMSTPVKGGNSLSIDTSSPAMTPQRANNGSGGGGHSSPPQTPIRPGSPRALFLQVRLSTVCDRSLFRFIVLFLCSLSLLPLPHEQRLVLCFCR